MIRSSLAPSMRVASMISSGTLMGACQSKKVPSALTPNGKMSAVMVLTSPTSASSTIDVDHGGVR
jgi:hypothetical protein